MSNSAWAAPDVSVVVPAYGACPHLPAVLAGLAEQTLAPAEVIVSHSGSGPLPSAPAGGRPSVRVLTTPSRLYPGAARNRGARAASGRLLAFLDADVRPARRWLEVLHRQHSQHPRDVLTGAVDVATSGGYWGMVLWMSEFNAIHPYVRGGLLQTGGASCNMMLAAELFEELGGFAPHYRCAEDTHLFARLRGSGHAVRFCADAIVHHYNVPGMRHCLAYSHTLGRWSGTFRSEPIASDGWVARSALASHLLWLGRFARCSARVLRWSRNRLRYLALAPGVLAAFVAWNAGFLAGAREARSAGGALPGAAPR